jgi:Cof subfamily protein (haloacid dehalogenase superfamily)
VTGAIASIRLVALDVDGTLVASAVERAVPQRTRETVRRVLEHGVEVVLVTGRMPAAALPVAADLGLTAPLVTHHGAAIVMPSGEVVEHITLDAGVARDALRWANANGQRAHLNRLDTLIMAAGDPRVRAFERVLGVRADVVAELRACLSPPVTKVMIGSEGHDPAADLVRVAAAMGDRATVTTSNPRFVEVLSPEASKARAVRRLADGAGISMADVLAIGDDVSDLGLLAAVGHPVAMPHAPPAVRALAVRIAPPLAEEGAASVLEESVLRQAGVR